MIWLVIFLILYIPAFIFNYLNYSGDREHYRGWVILLVWPLAWIFIIPAAVLSCFLVNLIYWIRRMCGQK